MNTNRRPAGGTYSIAAGVWLLLFLLQLIVEPQARWGAASPSLLIITVCADVLLLLIPVWALFRMVGLARGHHWSAGELLLAWWWVTALVIGTLHAGSPALLAAEFSTEPVYTAVVRVRRVCQLIVAPLAVISLTIISMKGLYGRSWPLRLALTIIPVVLLLWIWVARPQSP